MRCALSSERARIELGESRIFVREFEMNEIVGDPLGAGIYYFVSQLYLSHTPLVLYAGRISLAK
jgi:hypothetical protein